MKRRYDELPPLYESMIYPPDEDEVDKAEREFERKVCEAEWKLEQLKEREMDKC